MFLVLFHPSCSPFTLFVVFRFVHFHFSRLVDCFVLSKITLYSFSSLNLSPVTLILTSFFVTNSLINFCFLFYHFAPFSFQTFRARRRSLDRISDKLKRGIYDEQVCKILRQNTEVKQSDVLQVIQVLQEIGLPYLVSAYESDAQLTYLQRERIADVIITEDTDLIPFGASSILFKLKRPNEGGSIALLYQKCHLKYYFKHSVFVRRLCILSGCDYLKLERVGLQKAMTFMHGYAQKRGRGKELDFFTTLARIPRILVGVKCIPDDYVEKFKEAEFCFKHQLIYCPKSNSFKPLTPYSPVASQSTEFSTQDSLFSSFPSSPFPPQPQSHEEEEIRATTATVSSSTITTAISSSSDAVNDERDNNHCSPPFSQEDRESQRFSQTSQSSMSIVGIVYRDGRGEDYEQQTSAGLELHQLQQKLKQDEAPSSLASSSSFPLPSTVSPSCSSSSFELPYRSAGERLASPHLEFLNSLGKVDIETREEIPLSSEEGAIAFQPVKDWITRERILEKRWEHYADRLKRYTNVRRPTLVPDSTNVIHSDGGKNGEFGNEFATQVSSLTCKQKKVLCEAGDSEGQQRVTTYQPQDELILSEYFKVSTNDSSVPQQRRESNRSSDLFTVPSGVTILPCQEASLIHSEEKENENEESGEMKKHDENLLTFHSSKGKREHSHPSPSSSLEDNPSKSHPSLLVRGSSFKNQEEKEQRESPREKVREEVDAWRR